MHDWVEFRCPQCGNKESRPRSTYCAECGARTEDIRDARIHELEAALRAAYDFPPTSRDALHDQVERARALLSAPPAQAGEEAK
jgi:uncharacterized OB-fold protein